MEEITNIVPQKYHTLVLLITFSIPYITRAFRSMVKGGGVRGVWNSIMFGTSTPTGNGKINEPQK